MKMIRDCGFWFSSPKEPADEYFTPFLDFKAHESWSHICFVDFHLFRAQQSEKNVT